jgi:alpha-beta hydrolase superfamily lysophospholipase
VLQLPDDVNAPCPVVVGSHGLLSSKESVKQKVLAKACNAAGIAFLRFDHRGCGESQGEFSLVTSLAGRRADLLAAVETVLADRRCRRPLGLFGSSMGGATCIAAAARIRPEVMVTVAAPIRSRALLREKQKTDHPGLEEIGLSREQMAFDLTDLLGGLHNILVVHGGEDTVVPAAHARDIHSAAQDPKRLIIFKGSDHAISDPIQQKEFADAAVGWLCQIAT